MIPNIEKLVDIITDSIDRKKKVLLAGCGTSGRLGFFCSRQFNRILTKFGLFGAFDYSLAGDDEAIFVSNEIVEDSPQMGSDDLMKFMNQHNGLGAYVGITCGLSAPYVAGQLETAMEKGLNTILLGHNPPLESKDVAIEKWDKTFRDVVKKLMEYENGLLITPVFGGECISGSSRMKGGSGTFITLMTSFIGALSKKVGENLDVAAILNNFKASISHLYENNADSLAKLIQTEADSLKERSILFIFQFVNLYVFLTINRKTVMSATMDMMILVYCPLLTVLSARQLLELISMISVDLYWTAGRIWTTARGSLR